MCAYITPEEASEWLCVLTDDNFKCKTFPRVSHQYLSYNRHSSFNLCYVFINFEGDVQTILWAWMKHFSIGTSLLMTKSSRDKTTKVIRSQTCRGCPPSTPNRTSVDCVGNTLGPLVDHIQVLLLCAILLSDSMYIYILFHIPSIVLGRFWM